MWLIGRNGSVPLHVKPGYKTCTWQVTGLIQVIVTLHMSDAEPQECGGWTRHIYLYFMFKLRLSSTQLNFCCAFQSSVRLWVSLPWPLNESDTFSASCSHIVNWIYTYLPWSLTYLTEPEHDFWLAAQTLGYQRVSLGSVRVSTL